MYRNIYFDGTLINKVGIDRIELKKVVLKEIDEEVLKQSMTYCEVRYDNECVHGRQFYITDNEVKFCYLRIVDNELGTLTFGIKNKQYGIYEFSPKESYGGINLVNYSAQEIHAFIAIATIKLKEKYGLDVEFEYSEIRQIELNTTFALEHKFGEYRRTLAVMMFKVPHLNKDSVYGKDDKKTKSKVISGHTVYNGQMSICVYNKTKEMEFAIKKTSEIVVYDDDGVVVEEDLMRVESKIKNSDSVVKKFHGKSKLKDLTDSLVKQVFEEICSFYLYKPYEQWKANNRKELRKNVRDAIKDHRNWKIYLLEKLRNSEQCTSIPVLLEMNDLYDILNEFPDQSRHVKRRKSGFKLQKNDVFLQGDHAKYIEILDKLKLAIKNTGNTI